LVPWFYIHFGFEASFGIINTVFRDGDMAINLLKTKLFEIPQVDEKEFIVNLRLALFPKAKEEKYWNYVKTWYSWIFPCKPEVLLTDAIEKTTNSKLETKEITDIVEAFDNVVIRLNKNDFNTASFFLDLDYRFLFEGSLQPFKDVRKYFENFKEIKRKNSKENETVVFSPEELAGKLGLENNNEFISVITGLVSLKVLFCSGWMPNEKDKFKNAKFSISIKITDEFFEWYKNTVLPFQKILETNEENNSKPFLSRDRRFDTSGNNKSDLGSYYPDSAISKPELDKLKRYPFAKGIAETIAGYESPDNLVIGIYGSWGEGKTSVLNFIENELSNKPEKIIHFAFNPWMYSDERSLILDFFNQLSKAVGKPLKKTSENIANILNEYGSALTALQVPVVNLSFIQQLSSKIASPSPIELKKRVEKILKESNKRVVVFMDDIDRLENKEVQMLFRLIKVTAGFEYLTYVLAFDEEMVSNALNENFLNGRQYLEKIIQVPLRIPMANPFVLRRMCFESVEDVLRKMNITLKDDELNLYIQHFIKGIFRRIKNPRLIKRYINALMFSFPILMGEVNYVDLMIIEGIRVFYPNLYEELRSHEEICLGRTFSFGADDGAVKQENLKIIEKGFAGISPEELKEINTVIEYLFPRFAQGSGRGHNSFEYQKFHDEKRIASDLYFQRYFSKRPVKACF
jgi:hypothetical protein